MKNILRMKIFIRTFVFLSSFLCATLSTHAAHRYKIAIIHSYEKNYYDADRYRYILEKELKANGVSFEMKELFMNSDELLYHDEMARASFLSMNWINGELMLLVYSTIKQPIPY